jgi:hypothetical protein
VRLNERIIRSWSQKINNKNKKMSTKRNTKLNETEIQQLKQYAEQVNQLQTDIESNDALSIKHGKMALDLALKAGGILIEAKKLVKYGTWEKWVAESVPHISKRTALRPDI